MLAVEATSAAVGGVSAVAATLNVLGGVLHMMVRSVSVIACWGRTATISNASTTATNTIASPIPNDSVKATSTTTMTMQATARRPTHVKDG